jgi:hypothetical protein
MHRTQWEWDEADLLLIMERSFHPTRMPIVVAKRKSHVQIDEPTCTYYVDPVISEV